MRIALAWLYDSKTGNYWHNGATGGYSSYAFFNPKEDYAAVVLFNTTAGANGKFCGPLRRSISGAAEQGNLLFYLQIETGEPSRISPAGSSRETFPQLAAALNSDRQAIRPTAPFWRCSRRP